MFQLRKTGATQVILRQIGELALVAITAALAAPLIGRMADRRSLADATRISLATIIAGWIALLLWSGSLFSLLTPVLFEAWGWTSVAMLALVAGGAALLCVRQQRRIGTRKPRRTRLTHNPW